MIQTPFMMLPKKNGRIRYLLLVLAPPTIFTYLYGLLSDNGFLPNSKAITLIALFVNVVAIAFLGYFFIFKKNHTIEVREHSVTVKDWRNNSSEIHVLQIHSLRRNVLGELLLLDEKGKTLLCVEINMENRNMFEQWLREHNIN